MTKQREFKSLVRERMEKTGERYTTARAQLLSKLNSSGNGNDYPGLLKGYDRFGGVAGDTAVLCNVLRHAGIKNPLTNQPFDETTINGLCGGPGFLYAVFEYKGFPPMMTIVLRSRSMPDVYVGEGLKRLGVKLTEKQSSTPKVARKALDDALAAGKAAICTLDAAMLPWSGVPEMFAGGAPHMIAVVGVDGDSAWVDDRAPAPIRLKLSDLDLARTRYRAAKCRLNAIDGADAKYDARKALREAIADTAKSYHQYAVPKSFQSNCGFAGMEKWQKMLVDTKDKKGWPTVFAEKDKAYAGLYRAYDCIQYDYTAPAGGRAWYGDFLKSAAQWIDAPTLKNAAAEYGKSGALWAELAALVADCPDAAMKQSCELADRKAELRDHDPAGSARELAELWQKRMKLGGECKLTRDAAHSLYAKMSEVVGKIIDRERAAVDALKHSRMNAGIDKDLRRDARNAGVYAPATFISASTPPRNS